MSRKLAVLEQEIVNCNKCPRLRDWCRHVAATRRRAFRDWDYWGKPVPGFGDPKAQLLVLGLAPAAHGANRTGRVFTGDRSGDWLFRAMHQCGFANQPESSHRDDGLRLINAWVSASVRCAPPDNKPTPEEVVTCRDYLAREVDTLRHLRVVVALGRLAFDNWLRLSGKRGFAFGHNVLHDLGPGQPLLIASYHPSQQNTSTGKLTEPMLRSVFALAADIIKT